MGKTTKLHQGLNLVDIDKFTLKFTWKGKGPKLAKTIQKRRIKLEDSVYPILRHYIVTVIKTVWYFLYSWTNGLEEIH